MVTDFESKLTTAARLSAAVALAAIGGLTWPIAWGQSATAASQAGATGGSQLQEVVVTAERRATNVQTTPISVTALSGVQLQTAHVNTLQGLQTIAPVAVTNSGWHQQVNIRGIGNSVISASINIGVAVIRDGLFEAETLGQNEPLYDIHDTEVLAGPQGTFVGYASTGGAVEINSNNPDFRPGVHGYIQAQAGNYTDRAIQGAVNLPVSDTLALRLAFNDEMRNSFYKSIGGALPPGSKGQSDPGNVNTQNARLGVLWRPNSTFQALLKTSYDYEHSDGLASQVDPGSFIAPCASSTGPCTPGGIVHAPFYSAATHEPFVLNANRTDQLFNTQKSETSLHLQYTLADGIELQSITGFEQIAVELNQDSDAVNSSITNGVEAPGLSTAFAGFPSHGSINACSAAAIADRATGDCGQWQYRNLPNDDYWSEEIDVVSPTTGPFFSKFNWIAGATTFYRDTPVDASTYDGSAPYSPTNPQVSTNAINANERLGGVFGQISWQFRPTLQLQLGARENWDNNWNRGTILNYNPLNNSVRHISVGGQYSDKVPTGKVDLNWTPLPGQFFYAFFARGYKSGGVNNDLTTFKPEGVNDYELGWKGQLLNNHIQTQIGGYWMDYQHYQYSLTNPVTGRSDVVGLPAATIKGISASMQSHLGNFDVDVSVYYNKTSLGNLTAVEDYKLPSTLPGDTPGCAPGVATPSDFSCFQYAPYEVNLSGGANAFSPPLTANVAVDYNIAMGNGVLTPRVTYSHTDKQYGSIFQNDTYWLMPARNLVGADLEYIAGPWLLDAYGTNISNETYISGYYGAGGRLNDVFYGAPRQYGLRLNYTF